MEVAAAASVATSVVSLIGTCKDLLSSIVDGIEKVKLNNIEVSICFQKAKFLLDSVDKTEKKLQRCWLDSHTQDELTPKLEYIKCLLHNILEKLPMNQKKRTLFKAKRVKELIDTLQGVLREVDTRLHQLTNITDKLLAHSRCPSITSSAVSETDNPLPHVVEEVKVKPDGKHMVVSWKDYANNAANIKQYNIYVDDNLKDVYYPNTDSAESNEHSARLRTIFEGWRMYFVQVAAVNKGDHEGRISDHVPVYMNQHPPNVKPTSVTFISATSRTSVLFSVDRPETYNDMGITACKVHGLDDQGISLTKKEKCQVSKEHPNTLNFEIKDIDPARLYRLAVFFCNEHGDGKRSDELSFQINSMNPSKPNIILLRKVSSTSVQVRISTERNSGNVWYYYLFRIQGANGKPNMEPEPIKASGNTPADCEINGLKPSTLYKFYVVSIPVQELCECTTCESNILEVRTTAPEPIKSIY